MEYYLFPSLNKLKQTIEQVSTAPNSLLYAPSSASADKVTKNNLENKDIAEYQIYVRRLYISKEKYTVVAKITFDKNRDWYYDHKLQALFEWSVPLQARPRPEPYR